MPTYEYLCLKCKKKFERLQRITENAIKKCPSCGGKAERQIGGGVGLIFKGSGFYITDYKNKGVKRDDASSKEPAPKTASEKPKKP